jgi:hypothetical protein
VQLEFNDGLDGILSQHHAYSSNPGTTSAIQSKRVHSAECSFNSTMALIASSISIMPRAASQENASFVKQHS